MEFPIYHIPHAQKKPIRLVLVPLTPLPPMEEFNWSLVAIGPWLTFPMHVTNT